jgi:hypothetical protein
VALLQTVAPEHYKYHVEFSPRAPHSGTITIWVADGGDPAYADSTTLHAGTFTYQFRGVRGDGTHPVDSGTWLGSGPQHRPDAIWRPYPALTWTQYAGNPAIDEAHISAILSDKSEKASIQTARKTVAVPGNRAWTKTGVRAASGDQMRFDAQGTLIFDERGNACGPGGTVWADTRNQKDPLWQQPHGALIGKIGEQGAPFLIGDAYTVRAWTSGTIFLGVNDYWHRGNSGGFTVTITLSGEAAADPIRRDATVYLENLRFPSAPPGE